MKPGPDLKEPMARIESLVAEIEQHADPAARERSRALVQALLDVHRLALGRLIELTSGLPDGDRLIDALAADEAVALVFALHGLHPRDFDSRVRAAVEELRPMLLGEGVTVVLEAISDDGVRLKVVRAGTERVRAGAAKLRAMIEAVLSRGVPELATVEIDGLETGELVTIGLGPRPSS